MYVPKVLKWQLEEAASESCIQRLRSSGFRNINFAAGRWYFDAPASTCA